MASRGKPGFPSRAPARGAAAPGTRSLEFNVDRLVVGDPVWVSDPTEAFVPAEVARTSKTDVEVITAPWAPESVAGKRFTIPKDVAGGAGGGAAASRSAAAKLPVEARRLLPRAVEHEGGSDGVENMDNLVHLHE